MHCCKAVVPADSCLALPQVMRLSAYGPKDCLLSKN